jgi:hypothetical protein
VPLAQAMKERLVDSREGTTDPPADQQPILGVKCSWCGAIMRQSVGISRHEPLSWSHGICAACFERLKEKERAQTK